MLKDELSSLVTGYVTCRRRVHNFWRISNTDAHRPGWWPDDIPFYSPNVRERDASEGEYILLSGSFILQ